MEMEVASLAAVCSFRQIRYGRPLYSADALHDTTWQGRNQSISDARSLLGTTKPRHPIWVGRLGR